jgi:hypothetical protein
MKTLTWLEWYRAAGFFMFALDKMTAKERSELRAAHRNGVAPENVGWSGPPEYRREYTGR